ncbi:MAG: hypothetical protein PVI57_19430, partial [Gemmatimonadota bacterium]
MTTLRAVSVEERPGGRIRLVGDVRGGGAPEEVWYEVPASLADGIDRSGAPWLVALLPLAVTRGTPLRVPLPVDARLVGNLRRVMEIWSGWYPHLRPVPLEVEEEEADGPLGGRVAAFFSGGVDSFYTVLRHLPGDATPPGVRVRSAVLRRAGVPVDPVSEEGDPPPSKTSVEDLLTVEGFDIPLREGQALTRLRARHRRVADGLGLHPVPVATNLRETAWGTTDWAGLSHGCGLASVALILGRRYRRVLLAGGSGHHAVRPWGSHPDTDPLLSSSRTRFFREGWGASRLQKIWLVAGSEVALRALRVCWRSATDRNCERCGKCYRTLLALDLFDVLPEAGGFTVDRSDPGVVARLFASN